MKNDDLIGSVGINIVHINYDNFEHKINRLSEFAENWSLPSECPKCGRYIEFDRDNVNKVITCKCGQRICCQVSDELL